MMTNSPWKKRLVQLALFLSASVAYYYFRWGSGKGGAASFVVCTLMVAVGASVLLDVLGLSRGTEHSRDVGYRQTAAFIRFLFGERLASRYRASIERTKRRETLAAERGVTVLDIMKEEHKTRA